MLLFQVNGIETVVNCQEKLGPTVVECLKRTGLLAELYDKFDKHECIENCIKELRNMLTVNEGNDCPNNITNLLFFCVLRNCL